MEKHIEHGAPTECPNCKSTNLEEDSDYSGTEWSWYCNKCDWLGKAEAHSITVSLGNVWTHTRGKKTPQPRHLDTPTPALYSPASRNESTHTPRDHTMTALKIHTVHDADRTCQHCDGDTNLVHAEGFGLMHECEDCGDLSDPSWDLTFWNGARHTVIYRVRHNLFAWPDIATKNQLNELAQAVLEDPANAKMLRTMTGSVKPKVCALITEALPEPWEAHITTILP